MKKLKSMIFLLLTLVLIFCMMPTPTAFAAEMTGKATEEDIFQTAEVENSVDMSAISTYATRAEGKYGQRAVVWTCNGESLEYTYNGNSHDSAYLIMHEVWHNSEWHIAYCIQPGVNIVSTSVYDDEGFNGDALWGYLDADVQRAVSLALLYGYPNSLDSTDLSATVAYQVATYMVIQELIIGWRETTYPYAQLDDSFYDVFGGGTEAKPEKLEVTSDFYPELEGTYLNREDIAYAYNFLSEKLRKHDLIPSFASNFRNQAPTYTMTANGDGTYSVTLTDTNGILSEYSFSNTDNLTFSKSSNGKSVTITTSNPNLGTVTVAPTKTVPSAEDSAYLIWTADTGSQALVTIKTAEEDPVPAYFKVTIPTGTCRIIKEASNGGTVSGWQFTIKDSDGNPVGTYTTDSNGTIAVDLEPGTYTVTETAKSSSYWHCDTEPRTVTIKAGETSLVTFRNEYIGKCRIVKESTNGGTVSGWEFTIKDSDGNTVGTYTTGSTGIITVDLDPGTYTVTEIAKSSSYWHCDTNPQTVTITAGKTATVTFTNEYVGKCKIVKTTTNGGTVSGWEFTIKDSDGNTVGTYTTDSTGVITVDLDPGTYTVTEIASSNSYWHCDTEPRTVTVTAGKTATVTFTNEYIGKVNIIKTLSNPEAGTVEGWKFSIYKVTESNGSTLTEFVAEVTTNAHGTILYDLDPGDYLITEILEEGTLWQCTSENPQRVTVKAGETADVTFTNALRPGQLSVLKTDIYGEPLAGATFLLEWSEDGVNWSPVTQSDSMVVAKGCCSDDATQISPANGLIEWHNLYPTFYYRITEVEAPEGYSLLETAAFEGQLPIDDLTVTLQVVNSRTFMLPATGSYDSILLSLGVALCLAVCAGALFTLRRKEE